MIIAMDKRTRGCRSPDELALLSQNELITQLLEAQSKIEELESIQMSSSSPNQIAREEKHAEEESTDSSNLELESSETSSFRPTFTYSSSTSSGIIANPSDGTHVIINKLKEMLDGFVTGGDFHKPRHNPRSSDVDEFIVAYEYKGNFPNCDEDLSLCDSCEDAIEESEASRPSINVKTIWEEGDDDEIDDDIDEFPLIPSPILNTPPYEYVFLTKENEAKCRIYLNPKLNQVFQDELKKLEKTEQEQLSGHQMQLHHQKEGVALANHDMDINNQNHLANSPSTHEVDSVPSVSNVIHCFDSSDIDLELKKILMDKPPITHRIVRRKSRRERGSSVPAVDSYYGTKDLNKVGHASYFIPTLTSFEKRSIGWKPEYHYGHWKYSSINVPNSTTNQIPLHPHPHVEGETKSKLNHTNNNSGIHGNNPHHHQEIDVSGPFVIGADAQSLLESPASISRTGNVHANNDHQEGDTLSFITLSGGTDSGQSCHIIPDKSTLRKILRWIMPCIKSTKRSMDNVSVGVSGSVTDSKPSKNSGNNTSTPDSIKSHETTGMNKADSDETAIETLVEPPDRLNSPTSHTHISFDVIGKTGRFHINPRQTISPDTQSHNSNPSRQSQQHGDSRSHSHHHHSPHTHHHGIFHWKNILTHGTMAGDDSMTVVGGDVVESNPGSMTDNKIMEQDDLLESSGALREVCLKPDPNDSSDDDDLGVGLERNKDIERGGSKKKQNVRLRLKPCKAYSKLLTLKDLGYQSDIEVEGNELEVPNAENDISLDKSSGLGDKKHNNEESCVQLGCTMRTGGTRKISSNDASGNDGDDESSGSGFAFSSLSVSNQNSFTTTHFCDEQEFCANNIATCSRGECIETRFLDPKDLLVPRYEATTGDYGSLPFVYAVDGDGIPTGTDEMDIMFDEDVIQWMDHDFVEDVEEELGLLNSRIDNMLWSRGENLLWSLRNMGNETAEKSDNTDGTPEKVGGKHRIITLNDSALQNETDAINDNYSHNNLN